jgi:thioesterase domain-containing protein
VDQPLLGITLQRYESRSEPTSFAEIGRDLAKVIVEVNPSGPYILGGWCVDGTIAYEVAQRLRAMNREVSCVILLDAVNPTYRRLYRSQVRAVGRVVRRTVDMVREAGHLDSRGARAHLWDGLRDIGCRVGRALVPSSTVAEQNPEILQNDPDRQEFRKLLYIAEEEYTPAPTPIPLMLLRSSIEAYRDPDLGWRDVAQTSLETVEVQGDHIGMFREPHVASLASVLSEYLAKHAPSNCCPDKR